MLKNSPFLLENETAYRHWRARKLEHGIKNAADLVVELADPLNPSRAEIDAILERCAKVNMALYTGAVADARALMFGLAERLGLQRLEKSRFSDDDGISVINVVAGEFDDYVPYSNHYLHWHTDAYYNPPEREVRAFLLHCSRAATAGGESTLMDHEILYILLRDENPEHIASLMSGDVMAIPGYMRDEKMLRPVINHPVFSVHPQDGSLQMRYTERKQDIYWKKDRRTRESVAALERLLDDEDSPVYRVRMEAGMGLVCNNVPHCRSAFEVTPGHDRLLYRARYHDRIVSR